MKNILTVFAFFIISTLEAQTLPAISVDSLLKKETVDRPLKIFVISDLNGAYGSTDYDSEVQYAMGEIQRTKPDLVLCGGDMVAGQSTDLSEQQIKEMWEGFRTTILQPITERNIPFGFTVGNHDASPSYPTDRKMAEAFWTKNKTNLTYVDRSHYPFYFSYIKNNVFFLSWDAAGPAVPAEVQNWMQAQLNSTVAKNARLRILLGHLPLFPIVEKTNRKGEYVDNVSVQFFKDNNIDLYISGHQHAYYPAHKDGMQLLNAGCIGSGPRTYLGSPLSPVKTYTIIDVPVQDPKTFMYETYDAGSQSLVEQKYLPRSITGVAGTILRRDK